MSNTLEIKYKIGNDYKMVPVSGVFGGLDAQGNLTCEFYVEKVNIPETTKIVLDRETHLVKEEQNLRKSTEGLIREVQVGMTLNPGLARAIGEWLLTKVEEFETIKEKIQNETK
jgi:hypothetical protein